MNFETLRIDIESEAKSGGAGLDELIQKLDTLTKALDESTASIDKFLTSLQSIAKLNSINIPTKGFQDMNNTLMSVQANLEGCKDLMDAISSTEINTTVENMSNIVDTGSTTQLAQSTDTYGTDNLTEKTEQLNESTKKATRSFGLLKQSVKSVNGLLSTLGSAGRKSLSLLSSAAKNVLKPVKNLGDSFKKVVPNDLIATLKKVGLAMLGIRSTFLAVRKAVSAYMQYDTSLSEQMQQNWAVLGSLLAPILERLVKLFSLVVSYIAAFVKALTGVDLVARANAKALDSMGKSAEDALGNLAKFDDLNVVDFGKDSKTSLPELTVGDVDVSAIDWFVRYLKSHDWYGLGMEIGRLFNEGLRTIDFNWLEKEARQWGRNFADLGNGLTDGIDWDLLGEKVAGGLNTVLGFANSFLERYNFDNLGSALARGLNSMITNIKWDELGNFFANQLNAFSDILYNFVNGFDWTSLGEQFATGINSMFTTIDLGELVSGVSTGLQGILETITTTFDNINWDGIAKNINNGFKNLNLSGIGEALSKAIKSFFSNIGSFLSKINWQEVGSQIAEFILSIDWIGIHTSVIEFIGNVLLGLVEILWGYLSTMWSEVWNKFMGWFENTELGSALINMFSEAFEMVKVIWDKVEPYFTLIFDNVKNALQLAWDIIVNIFSTAWDLIKIVWDQVSGFFSSVWNSIADIFSVVKNVLSGNFKDAWNAIKDIVKTWAGFFEDTWKNIKKAFSTVVNFFGDTFKDAWTAVKNAFGSVGTFFSDIFDDIKRIFKKIGTTVGNAIGDSFANVVNTIIGFAENTVNKFIRAINKAINVINNIPGVDIKPLSEITIPKLATGTNRIEAEGLYYLHKNEAVVPEKYNPAVNDQGYKLDNSDIVNELRAVRQAISELEQTTTVNLGNKTLAKETRRMMRTETNRYGENVYSV